MIYQFHRGVFLFRGLDDGGFGEEEELVKLYSHLAGPTVYDYDRDGTLDLVIGGDERRMIEPAVPAPRRRLPRPRHGRAAGPVESGAMLALLLALLMADPNPITSGAHKDEGPADRYRVPYAPIVYGRRRPRRCRGWRWRTSRSTGTATV